MNTTFAIIEFILMSIIVYRLTEKAPQKYERITIFLLMILIAMLLTEQYLFIHYKQT